MSLPAATVWEVRPTVGSDTNGGAFVAGASGTDYSQQDAANSSGSNKSTADAVGVGTTTLTSVSASFTAAIVGNVIYLSGSGATTGWYEVTAYTNATTVTLDRNPGTGTGWTMNIGGALATVAAAYGAAALDNTIYIKNSGSLTVSSTLTLLGQNQTIGGFKFIGYGSTRGDNVQVTWTTATNSTDLIVPGSSDPANFTFENINFTCTAGTPGSCFFGGLGSALYGMQCFNCSWSGWLNAFTGYFHSGVNYCMNFLWFTNCTFESMTGDAVQCTQSYFFGCYFKSNGGSGINCQQDGGTDFSGSLVLDRCVFASNSGKGVIIAGGAIGSTSLQLQATNCVFYGNTSHGLDTTGIGGANGVEVRNCIFASNGGYGWNAKPSQQGPSRVYANAYYNNTSGTVTPSGFASATDVTLSASPFSNVSGDDFSLNSTAGGGAACKGVGYQGALNGAGSGTIDIGAVQSSGGGSGPVTYTSYPFALNRTVVLTED